MVLLLQVACHNTPTDCWVSLLGAVYDVTRLLRDFPGALTEPILAAAGTDVSHWCANTRRRQWHEGQHSTRDWLTHAAMLTRGVLLVLFHCRFDAATGDVRYCVDPETQLQVPYCPQVHRAHVQPAAQPALQDPACLRLQGTIISSSSSSCCAWQRPMKGLCVLHATCRACSCTSNQ